MITVRGRFNLYLLLALVATIACGCRTHKNDKSKQLATLRIHLEAGGESSSRALKVPIYRANPVDVQIEQDPFLTEAHVASAQVVSVLGGFDIQIQLNRQGTWLLQEYSAGNTGKHYAIFAQFGVKGKETRWLAAPASATPNERTPFRRWAHPSGACSPIAPRRNHRAPRARAPP